MAWLFYFRMKVELIKVSSLQVGLGDLAEFQPQSSVFLYKMAALKHGLCCIIPWSLPFPNPAFIYSTPKSPGISSSVIEALGVRFSSTTKPSCKPNTSLSRRKHLS